MNEQARQDVVQNLTKCMSSIRSSLGLVSQGSTHFKLNGHSIFSNETINYIRQIEDAMVRFRFCGYFQPTNTRLSVSSHDERNTLKQTTYQLEVISSFISLAWRFINNVKLDDSMPIDKAKLFDYIAHSLSSLEISAEPVAGPDLHAELKKVKLALQRLKGETPPLILLEDSDLFLISELEQQLDLHDNSHLTFGGHLDNIVRHIDEYLGGQRPLYREDGTSKIEALHMLPTVSAIVEKTYDKIHKKFTSEKIQDVYNEICKFSRISLQSVLNVVLQHDVHKDMANRINSDDAKILKLHGFNSGDLACAALIRNYFDQADYSIVTQIFKILESIDGTMQKDSKGILRSIILVTNASKNYNGDAATNNTPLREQFQKAIGEWPFELLYAEFHDWMPDSLIKEDMPNHLMNLYDSLLTAQTDDLHSDKRHEFIQKALQVSNPAAKILKPERTEISITQEMLRDTVIGSDIKYQHIKSMQNWMNSNFKLKLDFQDPSYLHTFRFVCQAIMDTKSEFSPSAVWDTLKRVCSAHDCLQFANKFPELNSADRTFIFNRAYEVHMLGGCDESDLKKVGIVKLIKNFRTVEQTIHNWGLSFEDVTPWHKLLSAVTSNSAAATPIFNAVCMITTWEPERIKAVEDVLAGSGDQFKGIDLTQALEDMKQLKPSFGVEPQRMAEALVAADIASRNKRLYAAAVPKTAKVLAINVDIGEDGDLRLRTLPDKHPRHFTIGSETNCCQVLGGAGEDSAIQSFINPNAGVLVCEWNTNNKWVLLSQSFFHVVPNGLMLDNVEYNSQNVANLAKSAGYKLDEIYAVFAQHVKEADPDIKFVVAGKAFSKISPHMFQDAELNGDPRTYVPYGAATDAGWHEDEEDDEEDDDDDDDDDEPGTQEAHVADSPDKIKYKTTAANGAEYPGYKDLDHRDCIDLLHPKFTPRPSLLRKPNTSRTAKRSLRFKYALASRFY